MKIDISFEKNGRSRGIISGTVGEDRPAWFYCFWVWLEGTQIVVAFDAQAELREAEYCFQRKLRAMIVNEYVRLCMAHKKTFPHSAALHDEREAGLTIWTDAASRNLIDICVDGRRGGDIYGRFYTMYAEEAVPFEGICALLLQMERVFDTIDFPMSATEYRRFHNTENRFLAARKKKEANRLKIEKEKGRQATFIVNVAFRSNSTWQGTVSWVDGRQEVRFRSALELIRLIDSVVGVQEEFIPDETVHEHLNRYAHRV